jgi:hypothetical protein
MSFFSRLFSPGERGANSPDDTRADRDSAVFADFLREAGKPRALDPEFEILLGEALRWEIAPEGVLERLPLTGDQREQYDFVARCANTDRRLYLLDSRPVWAPDVPYIPSFLLVADEGADTVKPLGTFDSKPENWVFAWQSQGSAR